ncbi:hypothetical protein H4V95_001729 [Arthrobacter sp. CAN_C5]|nr:hypothetical protein [Arthrobacter sp. CAN_C5]
MSEFTMALPDDHRLVLTSTMLPRRLGALLIKGAFGR